MQYPEITSFVMLVGLEDEKNLALKKLVENEYNTVLVTDIDRARKMISEPDSKVLAVLLDIDTPSVSGLAFLWHCFEYKMTNEFPVIIVTDDIEHCDMESAYEMGALDYITYDMKDNLIRHRIRKITDYYPVKFHEVMTSDRVPGVEAYNDYLFNNCVGAAMLIEYDGIDIKALMINDLFFKIVGKEKHQYEKDKNTLMSTVLPEDKSGMHKTILEALEKGTAAIRLRNEVTNQIFNVVYRHIAKGEYGDILFVMIEDITETVNEFMSIQAMVELPGTIIFDYIPEADRLVIHVSGSKGLHTMITDDFLRNKTNSKSSSWFAPESEKHIRQTFEAAMHRATEGYVDFRGRFSTAKYHWHRAYYRSLADENGKVFRVVGRVEDVEKAIWTGEQHEKIHIYDAATKLLTFQAIKEYITYKIGESHNGTMILIEVNGLEKIFSHTIQEEQDKILHLIGDDICRILRDGDICGRFGDEGFALFFPEASSEEHAREMSVKILRSVNKVLYEDRGILAKCSIGIAIADNEEIEVGELLRRANYALSKSREAQDSAFNFYNFDEMETKPNELPGD